MMARCSGHSRFSLDGIQAASGSLRIAEDAEEPPCAECYRGIGEFACRECGALVCFDHAHHYRGEQGQIEVFCVRHIPDAEETDVKVQGAAAA